jgi:ABC-type multidrug transport system fused ATPase/permease subunit
MFSITIFVLMKSKFAIINCCLMMVVLFVMLFQSFHSYEHVIEQFSEKKCYEKHDYSKTHFQHKHPSLDYCFSCEFTFSFFTKLDLKFFVFEKQTLFFKNSFFYLDSKKPYYNGISYSLRGPPRI